MNNNYKITSLISKSGHTVFEVNGKLLHSKYDPIKEAQRIISQKFKPNKGIVIFGYGNGYLVDELINYKIDKIFLFDPLIDEGVINLQDNHKPYIEIINCKYGLLEIELNLIKYTKNFRVQFLVIETPNYPKLFLEEFKKVLKAIYNAQLRIILNENTIIKYAQEWYVNFLNNLMYINKDSSIFTLKAKYNLPVVLVSSGPSLTKQLKLLEKIKDKVLIVTSGSAINALMKNNLEPDYVVSLDGSEANYGHFKDYNFEQTKLIYTFENKDKIRGCFKGINYFVGGNSNIGLIRNIEKQIGVPIPTLPSGGSVAHLAFSLSQYISNGPIAIIGQDLAYTGNKTHDNFNKYVKNYSEEELENSSAFKVKSHDGGYVWTEPSLDLMRRQFEEMIITSPPQVPFYNCTEGGANIEGYQNLKFNEFIDKYVSMDMEKEIFQVVREGTELNLRDFLVNNIAVLKNTVKILNKCLNLLKLAKSQKEFTDIINTKLNELDKKIVKDFEVVKLETLLQPINLELEYNFTPDIGATKEEEFTRIFQKNTFLYSSLLQICKFAKDINKKIIREIE